MRLRRAAPAVLAFASPGAVVAGEPPPPTPPLEIVVESPRRPDAGTAVTIVDAERIDRMGTSSVATTLERFPSLSAGGTARGERLLNLRGFDQRQIAVFVDGIPAAVPYDGRMDLDKLPVDMVSRVAVVKGATSLLYGPNGLGGAINVATHEPTARLSLRSSAELSPAITARSSLVGSGSRGPVGVLLGAGFEGVRYVPMPSSFAPTYHEDGGRRDNSDRLAGDLAAKLVWDIDQEHRVALSFSRFEGRFGVPPSTRALSPDFRRWSAWASSSVGLSHALRRGRLQTEEVLYLSLLDNTLEVYGDPRYVAKVGDSGYDDVEAGGFVRTTCALPVGDARALLLRTWTGLRHDAHVREDNGVVSDRVATNLATSAAQAELDLVPGWLTASAGVELDVELPDTADSGETPPPAAGWGPMGALTFTPARAWTVTGGVASRTRFPTLRERFSTALDTRVPNPLLRPERAVNMSLDVTFRPLQTLRFAAGVFDSELSDLIVTAREPVSQLQNLDRARLLGAEAQVTWTLAPWVDVLAGWMVLHARRLGASANDRVEHRPDNKGLVMLTVTPLSGLSLTGVLRHVGGQSFQDSDTGAWGRLGAYQLYDARVEWAFLPGLRAWVRMNNIADVAVEGRYSFPEAGRQVFVGLGTRTGP